MIGKIYSNTLLVSLNNRIAIRERSLPSSGERNVRSPVGSFPTITCRSEATTGFSLMDLSKASDILKFPPFEGLNLDERIITDSLSPSSCVMPCLGLSPLQTAPDLI